MSTPANLVSRYDQHKSEQNEFIDEMVEQWRADRDNGRSDFDIFGRQIAGIDNGQPSYERLAVLVALMVERLATTEVPDGF